MNEKVVYYLKRYIPAFAIMGVATWLILSLRGYSGADAPDVRYLNLADSFTIPAVIMLMVGLLAWISTTGCFDMFSYGISRAKESLIPSVNKQKDEKFYDYKVRKDKSRIKGYSFLFISGGVYFIPAIVFNVLYYTA